MLSHTFSQFSWQLRIGSIDTKECFGRCPKLPYSGQPTTSRSPNELIGSFTTHLNKYLKFGGVVGWYSKDYW